MSQIQYTPVRAPRGATVHITLLTGPGKTACAKRCKGWIVAIGRVNCSACKLMLHKACHQAAHGVAS